MLYFIKYLPFYFWKQGLYFVSITTRGSKSSPCVFCGSSTDCVCTLGTSFSFWRMHSTVRIQDPDCLWFQREGSQDTVIERRKTGFRTLWGLSVFLQMMWLCCCVQIMTLSVHRGCVQPEWESQRGHVSKKEKKMTRSFLVRVGLCHILKS